MVSYVKKIRVLFQTSEKSCEIFNKLKKYKCISKNVRNIKILVIN